MYIHFALFCAFSEQWLLSHFTGHFSSHYRSNAHVHTFMYFLHQCFLRNFPYPPITSYWQRVSLAFLFHFTHVLPAGMLRYSYATSLYGIDLLWCKMLYTYFSATIVKLRLTGLVVTVVCALYMVQIPNIEIAMGIKNGMLFYNYPLAMELQTVSVHSYNTIENILQFLSSQHGIMLLCSAYLLQAHPSGVHPTFPGKLFSCIIIVQRRILCIHLCPESFYPMKLFFTFILFYLLIVMKSPFPHPIFLISRLYFAPAFIMYVRITLLFF